MSQVKPMLASDVVLEKLNFPCIGQPKVDGVRGLNIDGTFRARSLKAFGNYHTQNFFSRIQFHGLDGELAAHRETHPDLCRLTSSATSTHEGEPFLLWWVFDDRSEPHLPYVDRLERLTNRIEKLQANPTCQPWAGHLRVIPHRVLHSLEEYLAYEDELLEAGFEGIIVRRMDGLYKFGRSTVREAGLLRGKRFVDFEFYCDDVEEGNTNENEATINELGHTTRSTHKENMTPNGMMGRLYGRACSDVVDPSSGLVVIKKDQQVKVGPGAMPHDMRRAVWAKPSMVVGQINKAKFFPKGLKDKPRFPTWLSVRDATDL